MKQKKSRLDALLVERGLVENIELAKAIIMSGNVYAGGNQVNSAGTQISLETDIVIRGKKEFVSRGGYKLKKALDFFSVSPQGKVCIDCGASTGGFTDCLLQSGARLVYAVDVAYGQLAWSLRNDPRVIVMERTNIRNINNDMFIDKPEIAVIDVSFMSLSMVLPLMRGLLEGNGDTICLVKPQFEAPRSLVGERGVVRDSGTHLEVLDSFLTGAHRMGYVPKGLTYSPIQGPEGNIEYLAWLGIRGEKAIIDANAVVHESHEYFASK